MNLQKRIQKGIFHLLFPAIFALLSNSLFAQNEHTECPFFLIYEASEHTKVSLVSTDVDVAISGVIANVVVEQTYVNSGEGTVEANYVFPMSAKAAVYAMEMQVEDRVIEAVIKEKEEAQKLYEEAQEKGQTVTLLEQQRPNVFEMSVANILPGDTIRVRMTYTELLTPVKGTYQFVFPTIVGPRYTTGGEEWVAKSMADSVAVSKTALSFDVKINGGMPVNAVCSSHEAAVSYPDGNTALCHYETSPKKDFVIDYQLNGDGVETGVLLYEEEDENFFLAMIQPPKPEVPYVAPHREYVFIIDISGSMSGTPLDISKDMITSHLANLTDKDKFNIVFFAGGSTVLSENSLPVTQANVHKALAMIDELEASGSTNLLFALKTALAMEGVANYSRTFAILTDGAVVVESEAFTLIRDHLNEANFFSFGIGNHVNRYIIEGIAYVGNAEPFVVTDMYNADSVVEEFQSYIENPVLTNISAEYTSFNVYDVSPTSIPDVFAERPVVIFGKYSGNATGTVSITGNYANVTLEQNIDLSDYSASDENVAIKYLWARNCIKMLSDYGVYDRSDNDFNLQDTITELGLKYNLVTDYTSLIALDTAVRVANHGPGEGNENYERAVEIKDAECMPSVLSLCNNPSVSEEICLLVDIASQFEAEECWVELIDATGKLIKKQQVSVGDLAGGMKIQSSDLKDGVYFIILKSGTTILDKVQFVK